MPATPTYGLPFPVLTDPADVPADVEALAEAVDDALGTVHGDAVSRTLVDAKGDILAGSAPDTLARVPVGADGYVLSGDSASPAGLKWIQLGGAYVPVSSKGQPNGVASLDSSGVIPSSQLPPIPPSGIQPSIIDAKGDLIAGQANDTPVRFAVGPDGQVLIADSASPLGLKWGPQSGGGGGGGIDPAIFDAKGDVLVASAPDTPARLGVGSNGQVLTADPAAANGLRYGERIDYENVYAPGVAYQPGDVVSYQGVQYLCVNPATGQTPPSVSGGGGAATPYALLQDQKAANTDGGGSTTGSFLTRTLNTKVSDSASIVALAANQFTLQPGTYRIRAHAPGYASGQHQTRIQNITDGTTVAYGSSEWGASATTVQNRSHVETGEFTITAAKTFELQHRFSAATATNGMGVGGQGNFGGATVFASVEIWKVA